MATNSKSVEVLLVDDDPMFNLISKTIVRNVGISDRVVEFTGGRALLAYLDRYAAADRHLVILLDINMPVVSGWDVLDVLERHPLNPWFIVVIVTSSIDRSDEQKARSYPLVVDFLVKPVDRAGFEGIKAIVERLG